MGFLLLLYVTAIAVRKQGNLLQIHNSFYLAINLVGNTNLDLLKLVKNIQLGEVHVSHTVDVAGVTKSNNIKPTYPAWAACSTGEELSTHG